MGMIEDLKELGVNTEEGLKRLNGNQSFYERMLRSVPKMLEKDLVDPEFPADDYGDIIEKTHAIKGATGNLSLTPLYEAYTQIVDLLRESKPEEARKILKDILPVQEQILNTINQYQQVIWYNSCLFLI